MVRGTVAYEQLWASKICDSERNSDIRSARRELDVQPESIISANCKNINERRGPTQK